MNRSTVDLMDLRAAADFEKSVKAFRTALDAFEPVIDRLEEAGYPGAADVVCFWPDLENLASVLKDFREADGDQGAFDYLHFVRCDGLTLHEPAQEILTNTGTDEDFQRVEGMRRYAASVA